MISTDRNSARLDSFHTNERCREIRIYRIKLRITLPDSYKLFLYSLGVTPFIRKKKRPKVVESA